MRIPVLFVALTCAGFGAQAVDTDTTPVAKPALQDRMAKARQSVDRADWGSAERELVVLVREAPQNADAHNLLGYTYRKRPSPDLAKAYEHYNLALKINPNHRGAHEYLGEAYLQDKRLPEAEQHLAALEKICGGTACEEYQDLAKSIAAYKARN